MFKINILPTPIRKKISLIPKYRSKRKRQPSVSSALLSACPLNVDKALELRIAYDLSLTPEDRVNGENASEPINHSISCSNSVSSTRIAGDSLNQFHSYYPDERTFKAALDLFNIQTKQSSSSSSTTPQKWECKGKIRASLQLCVLCKDIGKRKSQIDAYYLDVMEVKQYRTILCKGCLAYVLHRHVGCSLSDIEKKLKELLSKEL